MDDNRFLRAYREYKLEKKELYNNNRFECLKDNRYELNIRDAGRFECLRDNNYLSKSTNHHNRFSSLIDNNYNNTLRQSHKFISTPRPLLKESVNDRMKKYQEEKRIIQTNMPISPPVFSFESNYHFPELSTSVPPIKLPELKPQKDMILNSTLVPIKQKNVTVIHLRNGKIELKDIYEDCTENQKSSDKTHKNINYTSWASILKPKLNIQELDLP